MKVGQWLLAAALCLLALTPAQAQRQVNPFGVVEGFWFPDVTCALGVGWERIIFDWAQHQPTGPDDWHTLNVDDRWLKAASQCNREVVALLKHTPAWATDGLAGAGVPRGLDLPVDDPANVWAGFVRRAAEYYASRGVYHFIVWNEPDISPQTYGFEFEGGLEDYYQLLKVAYLAAKRGNPAAVIHLAGTTYWHDVNEGQRLYMDRLLERIAQDPDAAANSHYFDVFSLHIYFRTDTIYDIVREARALLDRYGLTDKRIWINETNAAPTDDLQWPVARPVYQLDLEQQAAFLVQAAALGLAAGAERIAVYKLYDQALPPGGESFGIISPADQQPRPAYRAWQTATRYLGDAVGAQRARTARTDAVRLTHRDGRQTLLAWARSEAGAVVEIDATAEKAHLMDQYGNTRLLRPDNGAYRLRLDGARCNPVDGCAVGGPVTILIQPEGAMTVRDVSESTAVTMQFE
ncbi:MAG: hypothetical protein ACUVSX_14410 [Aggregatilineales bacterium]